MNRVVARDFALFVSHPESMYRDGHDNNWLLLEFLLGVPLAVGFKSEWSAGTTGHKPATALLIFHAPVHAASNKDTRAAPRRLVSSLEPPNACISSRRPNRVT